jgi:hypothetical protein
VKKPLLILAIVFAAWVLAAYLFPNVVLGGGWVYRILKKQ